MMLSRAKGRCSRLNYSRALSAAKDLAGTHQNPVVEELWEARRMLKERHQGDKYERSSEGVFVKKPSDSQWEMKYEFSKQQVSYSAAPMTTLTICLLISIWLRSTRIPTVS
jgi:hypothetical protein